MTLDKTHSRFQKSLKCKDCFIVSDKVDYSSRYDVNLCIPCLMLRIKEEIIKD